MPTTLIHDHLFQTTNANFSRHVSPIRRDSQPLLLKSSNPNTIPSQHSITHNTQLSVSQKRKSPKKKTKKKLGVSHCYCRSPSPQPLLPAPAKGPAAARNLHLHAKPHRIPARARLKLYELPPGGEEAKTKKTQMVGSD